MKVQLLSCTDFRKRNRNILQDLDILRYLHTKPVPLRYEGMFCIFSVLSARLRLCTAALGNSCREFRPSAGPVPTHSLEAPPGASWLSKGTTNEAHIKCTCISIACKHSMYNICVCVSVCVCAFNSLDTVYRYGRDHRGP